jgi:beta-carotene 3-hydroxylase
MLLNALIVVVTVVLMEVFSIVAHKYVMHGFGWGGTARTTSRAPAGSRRTTCTPWCSRAWRSPSSRRRHAAAPSAGVDRRRHDGLRLAVLRRPRRPGAPALALPLRAAQRLPEAPVPGPPHAPCGGGKEGAVSFGFLYAPPVDALKRQLHALHQGPLRQRRPDAATARPEDAGAADSHQGASQRLHAALPPAGAAWWPSTLPARSSQACAPRRFTTTPICRYTLRAVAIAQAERSGKSAMPWTAES